jgi:hypothetical protein
LAELREPKPVKLFVGALFSPEVDLDPVRERLEEAFGPIDYTSKPLPFEVTDYYEREMGPHLKRVFFSFLHLVNPGELASIKGKTNLLEEELALEGRRRVNLDPGYMDYYKIVLASGKPSGQKVYLGQGIYADPALYYDRGWKPYDWGFPDFRQGLYNQEFNAIRGFYKRQCRDLCLQTRQEIQSEIHHAPKEKE